MASMAELSFATPVAGRRVLFVMAAEAEYGPHLRARFTPLMTGVGPVEAGVVVSAALSRLSAAGNFPDLVVSLGSAGSRTLEQTAVYQVASVSYRDMDASVLGVEKGANAVSRPACGGGYSTPHSGASSGCSIDRREHYFRFGL